MVEPVDGEERRAENGRGAAGEEKQVVVGSSNLSEHAGAGTTSDGASGVLAVEMPATRQEILNTGEEVWIRHNLLYTRSPTENTQPTDKNRTLWTQI